MFEGKRDCAVGLSNDYSAAQKRRQEFISLPWRATHPRVMEAYLLHKIQPEAHLQRRDPQGRLQWITCCIDMAESFVALEHARLPLKLELPRPAYVYNKINSLRFANSYYNRQLSAVEMESRRQDEAFVRGFQADPEVSAEPQGQEKGV